MTAVTGRPVSRDADTSGSATVAEASTNVGVGAVHRADPAEPPEDLRDVRAEDAAVVVALVDHDVAQLGEEPRPPCVGGEQ